MGKDSSDIIRYFFFKNTPNIIPMLFPLCEVGFIYSGIVQMCTPCPGTLNRRAGTISTPLYTFSLSQTQTLAVAVGGLKLTALLDGEGVAMHFASRLYVPVHNI